MSNTKKKTSKTPKRTRITPNKSAPNKITIQEVQMGKDGFSWVTYLVQGWKEDGKWKRKQFKGRADAERFVALKTIEQENQGRNQRMILTPLTDEQATEAVEAFDKLGGTYTLKQAVDFFLKNHRPPNFTIKITDALDLFSAHKVDEGIRHRTLRGMTGNIKTFAKSIDDPELHTVTTQMVEKYLRGLRAIDGVSTAKRKSWNTHRNDISQFFAWSMAADIKTNRPWCFTNPVEPIHRFKADKIAEQRPRPTTTQPEDLKKMLSALMRYQGGKLVKFFVLSYFAGIRPEGELEKLADREKELINLKTGFIFIPAEISKTKKQRQVKISKNLLEWLKAYSKFPIIPVNFKMMHWKARTHYHLKRDETRHSFISYHVAIHRSIGEAAMQAGNSESMVERHYLNLHDKEEGDAFFSLVPDMKTRRAVIDTTTAPEPQNLLRAI